MDSTVIERAPAGTANRYAQCIEASKRVRWDIDRDVIRGRDFDYTRKFLPDSLSKVQALPFLSPTEKRFLSQVQGRTYANMFALVERFIGSKTTELSQAHSLGDQVAFEALVRLTDEELKHQELFRRLDVLMAAGMPAGYTFLPQPNEVAEVVLGKGDWAVMALTLDIEIFSQVHYRASIEPDGELSALWKDVFLFHWKEESQHAILDELEWRRVHAATSEAERDRGVDELIELVGAVDGICQAQSACDAAYFMKNAGRKFTPAEQEKVQDVMLQAYRWQYVASGAQLARYGEVLQALTTPAQMARIQAALAPVFAHVGA
ncbi:hypothetical protein [Caenimonas aquaedulcis]|uniref:Ferritin-like domain-containing protein n=1 Tax=Caenimonas aquaedulcis TaxID=2793270 RepID=A0A931H6N5_9BURK|nr:hypothetical protein [Caenimonas aquaedulcis]MBG9389442.1 hypothetical protein [Caenimonas aquaedulcis]